MLTILSLSLNDHLMHIDQTSWRMRSFRLTSPLLERKCKWDSSLLMCFFCNLLLLILCLPSQIISYRDLPLSVWHVPFAWPRETWVRGYASIRFLNRGLSHVQTREKCIPSSVHRRVSTLRKVFKSSDSGRVTISSSGYVTKKHLWAKTRTQSRYLFSSRQCLGSLTELFENYLVWAK